MAKSYLRFIDFGITYIYCNLSNWINKLGKLKNILGHGVYIFIY